MKKRSIILVTIVLSLLLSSVFCLTASAEKVRFNANGGSIDTQYVTVTIGGKCPELPVPVKDGFVFAGWNTSPQGTGNYLTSGDVYTYSSSIVVYAVWAKLGDSNLDDMLNIKDILHTKRVQAEEILGTQIDDVNGDGKLTINDVNCMKKLLTVGANKLSHYTVNFYDGETLLKTVDVLEGFSTIAPKAVEKKHLAFKGWDKPFDAVTGNLDIYAVYESTTPGSSGDAEIITDWPTGF